DVDPVLAGIGSLVDAAVILLIEHIWRAGMLYDAVDALTVFRIDDWLEAGAGIAIGKSPGGSAVGGAYASYGTGADPHAHRGRVIGDNGVQTQPASTRFPAGARGMIREPFVYLPGHAPVAAHPEAGRIYSHIDHSRLTRPSRHDGPDVLETLATVFRK